MLAIRLLVAVAVCSSIIASPLRLIAQVAAPVVMEADTVGVRIQLGVTDTSVQRWDATVRLNAGEILRIDPWRMRPGDSIDGTNGWKATSYQLTNPPQGQPRYAPTGVVLTIKPAPGARLDVSTPHGDFQIPLHDVRPGLRRSVLDGRVMVDGVVPAVAITAGAEQYDFPHAATAPDGSLGLAFVAHAPRGPADLQSFVQAPDSFQSLVPSGGGDQVLSMRFDGHSWTKATPVSAAQLDLWRPTITLDNGSLQSVWAQNFDDDWDLVVATARSDARRNATAPATQRLKRKGNAISPVIVSDSRGRTWCAWQERSDDRPAIWVTQLIPDSRADMSQRISDSAASAWSPAIAADAAGTVYVAYDSYRAGNYDVFLHAVSGGKESTPMAIANSSRFEARPHIVCDGENRVWIAYEQRATDWGKDFGPLSPTQGSPLYMRGSSVQVRCVENGKLMQPTGELMKNWPDDLQRYNSYPRLAFDGRGQLWLLFRHRHEVVWGGNPSAMMVGGVWLEYASSYDGEQWSAPMLLASSDNLLDVRPAIALVRMAQSTKTTNATTRLVAIYPSDGRLRHEAIGEDHQRKVFFTGGGVSVPGQVKNELFAALLPDLGPAKPMKLKPADAAKPGPAGLPADTPAARGQGLTQVDPESKSLHPNFADDLKRIREYRIRVGGKQYQLLRGEFHRHTEWSMDGADDGSLEDMWRYAIDAAALDWIGSGDHDLGGGREYPWWIIQKSTDLHNFPPHFIGMHTYERSVPYPNGHRNVMFDRRGIRTLPRLLGDDPGGVSPDDTKMLYRYLKEFGGLCAVHTSGTGMGTDWRDNDSATEPIVEIYQGDRNSYEALGGPRVARKQGEAIGGWRPLGMVWNAMAIGHKFGFQASSDHWSTHISYAIAIAEEPTREAIVDAFKKRHCYAATDNIILDVRMGDAMMGDEVRLRRGDKREPKLSVRVIGTAPLTRVDVIKDFDFVYSTKSDESAIQFDWTDPDLRPGTSWYYVRVLQSDGQVAWGSPIWVQLPAAPAR